MLGFLFFLGLLFTYTVFAVYAERKIAALIQDRMGPTEVGPKGLLQTVADLLKLLQKEDIIPEAADRILFRLAPTLIFVAVFVGFSVIPLHSSFVPSATHLGIYVVLSLVSFDVIGLLLAGWSSNSKFALYGAMRAVAQIVSYEIPLGLAVLCVVMVSQSMDLQEICFQQGSLFTEKYRAGTHWLGAWAAEAGGFLMWNVLRVPVLLPVFVLFFIAGLAESNRAPFDIPEGESEIIAGFHTEYSGFRWSMMMLAEYGMMLLISMLTAILFFGGWQSPLPNLGAVALADWTNGTVGEWSGMLWGVFWFLGKTFFGIFLMFWIRWTYPRLRVDQLMSLCWKYLIPAGLLLFVLSGLWRLLVMV